MGNRGQRAFPRPRAPSTEPSIILRKKDPEASPWFDPACTRCARLAAFLGGVRRQHPDYHAAPVAPFGPESARLLIVGLAPGMHGANRTGRPFTGDYAGVLLYRTLHRHGFANQPNGADPDDGLELVDCRISNAVKCLPPENKPTGGEVGECNRFLAAEIRGLPRLAAILALGRVAHGAALRALGLKAADYAFGHASEHALPDGRTLIGSYHCSRYNTQTRRLTDEMFDAVVARAAAVVSGRVAKP